MNKIIRYIAGYIFGIIVFVILIPYGIFRLSLISYPLFEFPIISIDYINIIIAVILFTYGIVFIIWSNIFLVIRGKGGPTNVMGYGISPQTKKLVISGPYRYTRNPMVFGAFSLYLSIAVYCNSLACLLAILLFFVFAVIYIRLFEEKRLMDDFGDEYISYKKTVSMIVPLPSKIAKISNFPTRK